MPNWQMRPQDRHYVGDFDGDGKDDLWVTNGTDWDIPYLGMIKSNGNILSMTMRYSGNMPNWQMRPQDRHYVGDFDGDGKDDLFVFNGTEWAMVYLGMLKSTGSNLTMAKRYDGSIPGWQMRKNDRHYISDINGDGKSDLFVYNYKDWLHQYIGTIVSNGNSLTSTSQETQIGEWILGHSDIFERCNYEGLSGKRDLIVHDQNWLGMIRNVPGPTGLTLQKIYYKWIHNYHYGRNW
jgi:VCBS repeat protein